MSFLVRRYIMEDCTFVRQCAPNQQKKLNKEMKHRSLTEPVFAEILFCTGGNQLGTCIMNFRECVPVDQCNWRECCLNC